MGWCRSQHWEGWDRRILSLRLARASRKRDGGREGWREGGGKERKRRRGKLFKGRLCLIAALPT